MKKISELYLISSLSAERYTIEGWCKINLLSIKITFPAILNLLLLLLSSPTFQRYGLIRVSHNPSKIQLKPIKINCSIIKNSPIKSSDFAPGWLPTAIDSIPWIMRSLLNSAPSLPATITMIHYLSNWCNTMFQLSRFLYLLTNIESKKETTEDFLLLKKDKKHWKGTLLFDMFCLYISRHLG